jgi:hypothetical protein
MSRARRGPREIKRAAGVEESAIHALMMTEARIPATLGLFLEINAGVIAMTLAAFGLHQATAAWDVAYADERRRVTPTEQHVHGLLEQGPAMATAFLASVAGLVALPYGEELWRCRRNRGRIGDARPAHDHDHL